jgi:hypothetical protein
LDQTIQCTTGQCARNVVIINIMAAYACPCIADASDIAHTQPNACVVLDSLIIEPEDRNGEDGIQSLAAWVGGQTVQEGVVTVCIHEGIQL